MEQKAMEEFQKLEEKRITGEIQLRELEDMLRDKQKEIEEEEQ